MYPKTTSRTHGTHPPILRSIQNTYATHTDHKNRHTCTNKTCHMHQDTVPSPNRKSKNTVKNEHLLCSLPTCPMLRFIHHSVYMGRISTLDTLTCRVTCRRLALLKYSIDTLDTLDTVKSKTLLRMEITVTKSCEILQTSHMSHMWES